MPVKTQNLRFQYNDDTAFQFPDIAMDEAAHLLILGESGKGKTTLLHLLGGLLSPSSGSITIDEAEISKYKKRKLDHFRGRNIGIVFQRSYFVKSLSIKDNLLLAQKLAGKKEKLGEVKTALAEVGIESKLNSYPSDLSIGEQQRASIARAVLNNPSLLLADEPTSALDDVNTGKVSNLLRSTARRHSANLIVVTHDHRLKADFDQKIEL